MTIDLTDRVAVLVGLNGAGKSAILEGFKFIASTSTGRPPFLLDKSLNLGFDAFPMSFKAKIQTAEGRLEYQYELYTSLADDPEFDQLEEETSEGSISFNDRCWYWNSPESPCWETSFGAVHIPGNPDNLKSIFFSSTSALSQVRASRYRNKQLSKIQNLLPGEMSAVFLALSDLLLVGTNPVRESVRRIPIYNSRTTRGMVPSTRPLERLVNQLLRFINGEDQGALQSLIRDLGLGQEICVQEIEFASKGQGSYFSRKTSRPKSEEDVLQEVLMDGVNVGLLSDGTLRVLMLLMDILTSKPGSTLMIEEPESQVHPGLLENLLSVMESYTYDKNLILTTHSPQVVSWAKPEQLNLVYRQAGQTTVRKLTEAEVGRVGSYLSESGNLGEWIYSGLLDDEDS